MVIDSRTPIALTSPAFPTPALLQIHKIMQGLYDQHSLMHDPDALGMVEGMANYFCTRIESLIASRGLEYWHQCLNVEFGGMNEV